MITVSNVPVVGKFLIVLGVFGALVLGSVVFSTGKMRHIDESYSGVIEREGKAAIAIARANRMIGEAHTAVANLVISTTDQMNNVQLAKLKAAKQAFADLMTSAKAADVSIAATIDEMIPRGLAIFDRTCAQTVKLGSESTDAVGPGQTEYLQTCNPAFGAYESELTALADRLVADEDKIDDDLTAITNSTILITYATVIGGMALVILGGFVAIRIWVSRPLQALAETMGGLVRQDYAVAVAGLERKDEIGTMARAVQVFKENGLKLKDTEADALRHRSVAEQERAANEATRVEIQRQQEAVVASIADGLDRLSKGDLTGRLSHAFSAEYEKLRADFNATAESLQDALGTIFEATTGISTGSDQIAQASDDLSRRTEQQAANLEETAAALNVITDTVKTMAANASEAAKVVVTTRTAAESSGAIVQQAVEAMGKIKDSSTKITNIIGVIDEIAFQTNLLALNAGVEAARAGDAGRGFAVVASEVRGLAQRSAEAAKEIKALISASSTQVETGVVLVDKTGVAPQDIAAKVAEMDGLVRQISSSAQEQSTGLAEINTAVGQMDQVVQQNAAMVEESTAAAHALKTETQGLSAMVGRFDIGADRAGARGGRGNPVHAVQAKLARSVGAAPRPAPRPMLKTVNAAKSNAAPDKGWEEF